MHRTCAQRYLPILLASLLGTVIASSAHGDPITIPGYTVTNLGTGTPTFATDAAGNGILTTAGGQVYAWQPTNSLNLTQAQIQAGNYPFGPNPYANNPQTYGNPANAYQQVVGGLENSNGIVAAEISSGVGGHFGWTSVSMVQTGSNGAWSFLPSGGAPGWSTNEQFFGETSGDGNLVVGLNNKNEMLGNMGVDPNYGYLTDPVVSTAGSNSVIDLAKLFYANPLDTYADFEAISLDSDGRILLNASYFNDQTGNLSIVDLLLTPTGLSADPLEVPAPEPGTLAIAALAIAGVVAHRLRERRGHSRFQAC